MVGAGRFELPTPGPPDMNSGQLICFYAFQFRLLARFVVRAPGLVPGHYKACSLADGIAGSGTSAMESVADFCQVREFVR
jgi:hypothetical protein